MSQPKIPIFCLRVTDENKRTVGLQGGLLGVCARCQHPLWYSEASAPAAIENNKKCKGTPFANEAELMCLEHMPEFVEKYGPPTDVAVLPLSDRQRDAMRRMERRAD